MLKKTVIFLTAAACLFGFSLLSGCDSPGFLRDASTEADVTGSSLSETEAAPETTAAPESTVPPETETPGSTVPPETAAVTTDETTAGEAGPKADAEPPFFLHFSSAITLERGETFDVHEYVSYLDDLDSDVEFTVCGSVDTGTVGEYPLTLTLRDDAGNSASANTTVTVAESVSHVPENPVTPKSFADFSSVYKKDGTAVGIDVSMWQGDIDFSRVAEAGCEFVIIRIGGYAGALFEDPYYKYNIRNAKAAGLKVGVYWYSEENGPDKVCENADYLYSLLDGETLDFPVFFDWEDYFHFEDYKMSRRDLNGMFLAFREEAEAHGYKAALYNSAYYLDVLWSEEVKGDGVWLAHYVDETNYGGKYLLWQQGFGRIDGISGDVDVDVRYGERSGR